MRTKPDLNGCKWDKTRGDRKRPANVSRMKWSRMKLAATQAKAKEA